MLPLIDDVPVAAPGVMGILRMDLQLLLVFL